MHLLLDKSIYRLYWTGIRNRSYVKATQLRKLLYTVLLQDGLTALHCASREGHTTIVESLIGCNSNIAARTKVPFILRYSIV